MAASDSTLPWVGPIYISTDLERDAREYPLRHRIMTAPIPAVVAAHLRDRPSKSRVAAVRALLQRLGLGEVKVRRFPPTRTSRGKGREVCVQIPYLESDHDVYWSGRATWADDERLDCWRCDLRVAACARLSVMLYTAFPDLEPWGSDYVPAEDEYYRPLFVYG